MLKNLFNKHSVTGKCYFLYAMSFDSNKNQEFFISFKKYFEEKYSLKFSYIDFHDDGFGMHYMKTETGIQKLAGKFQKQIHLSLYDGDLRKKENSFNFEFDISKPVMLNVVAANKFEFDIVDLCKQYSNWTDVFYGFSYNVDMKYYPASFGIGDHERVLKLSNIEKAGKEEMKRWNKDFASVNSGFFRDVFEENILNSSHLNLQIDGLDFSAYINQNALGELSAISNGLYCWKLNDNQLLKARQLIYASKFVL